jgi:hypothetical protein
VRQGVRADLRERALEEHEVGLVKRAAAAVTQLLHGVVQDVEGGFQLGEFGLELEGLSELRSQ